ARPRVGVLCGSASDLPVMEQATSMLERLEIPYEFAVISAHRNPERVDEYARTADDRGLACIICAAGMANHLAGAVAARTALPEMAAVWSEQAKLDGWTRVEVLACEAWARLGRISQDELADIRARATPPSPLRVAELERIAQHDVAAFVQALAEPIGTAGRW